MNKNNIGSLTEVDDITKDELDNNPQFFKDADYHEKVSWVVRILGKKLIRRRPSGYSDIRFSLS
jgi:hypothetical protein